MIRYFALLLLLFPPMQALAVQDTSPLAVDSRIRTFVYDPNQVYKFVGHYKYQSSIEFAPDEEIATISMGDSLGWQVSPSGNRMFLKPIDPDATTNMAVITNKRIYHFELYGEEAEGIRDEEMIFSARFVYPDEGPGADIRRFNLEDKMPDIVEEPEKYNFNYTISGEDIIAPLKIFDDGEFTYFQFKNKNADLPAFFLVDSENREAVVNYRIMGDYLVVERVASRFTLRHGVDVACIFNENMPPRMAPKPPERKFLGIF